MCLVYLQVSRLSVNPDHQMATRDSACTTLSTLEAILLLISHCCSFTHCPLPIANTYQFPWHRPSTGKMALRIAQLAFDRVISDVQRDVLGFVYIP